MLWSSYLENLRAAFLHPATVFFADTSFLFAAASLHSSARAEIGAWIAALGPERFVVPAWVAQEVFRRMSGDQAPFTPMKVAASNVAGPLGELRAEARRFVDDAVAGSYQAAPAGRRDRGSFLIGLDGEVASLERRLKYLKDSAGKTLDDAADFLSAIVNAHLLPSDFYRELHTLEAEYQARIVGDHPPGYKDKRKDANRYGDLLVWREIVAYCEAKRPATVIVCSNDTKPDWVFTPPVMIDDTPGVPADKRQVPNNGQRGFKIILPQPLLVHELGREVDGFELHLMTSQMLARLAVDGGLMPGVVQAYSQLAESGGAGRDDAVADGGGGIAEAISASPGAQIPDLSRARAALATIDHAVDAIADIGALLAGGTLAQTEVRGIGRATVEAAETGPEAVQLFGRTLLEDPSLTGSQWSVLFEGMLLGAYTRDDGRVRHRPFGKLLGPLFEGARRDLGRPAAERLRGELGSLRTRFALLPGESGSVDIAVVSLGRQPDGTKLGGLSYGETQLLVDGRRQGPNSLFTLSGGALSTTAARLKRLLSDYFKVPEESVTLNLASADRVSWDEVQTLVYWGADTERQLR